MTIGTESHSIKEMKSAINRFETPDSKCDFDRSRVGLSPAAHSELEAKDREVEFAIADLLKCQLSETANICRCSVYKSLTHRVYANIYTFTDLERDNLILSGMNRVHEVIYRVLTAAGWFEDGKTKMGLVIDSDETVMRDFGGYFLREH